MREMFGSLSGRTVVVTGASRGIGKGMALRFGEVGCNVLVVSRHDEDAQAVARSITDQGGTASGFAADVSSRDDTIAMARAAVDRFGGLDILCNNAGIFPSVRLEDMSPDDLDLVLDTNLKGAIYSVQSCMRHMKQQGRGRIVLTSSITGPVTGFPGWTHYGASKAGLLGFMRSAALELAGSGITINAVLPGNIITEGLADMGDAYLENMKKAVPLKRLGTVEDIANAALFLALDESAFITGQGLIVDGGQTLPESPEALAEAG